MKLTHYFLAIPVNKEIKLLASSLQDELREFDPFKMYVHPDDLHITIHFFGEMNEDDVLDLANQLQVSINIHPFTLNCGELHYFGQKQQPRVVWLGVQQHPLLTKLYESTQRIIKENGYSVSSKKYVPHITLAKKWKSNTSHFQLPTIPIDPLKLQVEKMVLYKIHPQLEQKYEEFFSILL